MQITFNTKGHDPFIDFLKAYCILVVIFCHGFPYLNTIGYPIWGVQIPLFFLIQVFHCYKRESRDINWRNIVKRVVIPFVTVEVFILAMLILKNSFVEINRLIYTGIIGGGYGPGAYYPWIYLQMVVLIPFVRPICEKLNNWQSLIVFFIISECLEVFCSLINIPDALYRLLCFRYVFLIYFGWIWAKEGIKFNTLTIVFSVISLCSLLFFAYGNIAEEPFFFSTAWSTHRWPCYYWVSYLFAGLLYSLYKLIRDNLFFTQLVCKLSLASYEIFLVQMIFYSLLSPKDIYFINNEYIQFALWYAFAFLISIAGGIGLYKIEKKYI